MYRGQAAAGPHPWEQCPAPLQGGLLSPQPLTAKTEGCLKPQGKFAKTCKSTPVFWSQVGNPLALEFFLGGERGVLLVYFCGEE